MKKKILIVEDELLIAKVYSLFLQRMGYEVLPLVNNGNTAVEAFKTSGADVILMDIHLKNNTNGFTAAREIRKNYADVFIIFTTGNSVKEAEEESSDIKNCVVLIKPVETNEIDRIIRNFFQD